MSGGEALDPPAPRTRLERLTLLLLIVGVLGLALTALIAYPTVHSLVSGVSVSAEALTATILVFLLLFGIVLTFLISRSSGLLGKPQEQSTVVPESLLNDWLELLARTKQIYSPQSSHVSAFAVVALQIRNNILPQARQQIQPSEQQAAIAADASMLAVNNILTIHVSLGWAGWLLEGYAKTDITAFWAAKEIIENVVTGGAMFANNWVGLARQAGAASLGQHLKDEWNNFRGPANRLGEDLAVIARKTFHSLGQGTDAHAIEIRDL